MAFIITNETILIKYPNFEVLALRNIRLEFTAEWFTNTGSESAESGSMVEESGFCHSLRLG